MKLYRGKKMVEVYCGGFNLALTLESGQMFRFRKEESTQGYTESGSESVTVYYSIMWDRYFVIVGQEYIDNVPTPYIWVAEDMDSIMQKKLLHYFDIICIGDKSANQWYSFDPSAGEMTLGSVMRTDPLFAYVAKSFNYAGVHILRQDPVETLLCFSLSASNGIPRIMSMVDSLCTAYGEEYVDPVFNIRYHASPTLDRLTTVTEKDLRYMRFGFHAKTFCSAVKMLCNSDIGLKNALYDLQLFNSRQTLLFCNKCMQDISGVGKKITDCVLLFGCHKLDVVPVDVWVKRINEFYDLYIDGEKHIPDTELAGVVQQYLYMYARQHPKEFTDTHERWLLSQRVKGLA